MTLEPEVWIGASVERLEDLPLLTGHGRFAGDLSFPHQLHMRVLRGVIAVWTAIEVADLPPIDFREGPNAKLEPFRQPVLAKDHVRYVGEPVAAVFADDAYIAEDAAELV